WLPFQRVMPGPCPFDKTRVELVLWVILSWAVSVVIELPFFAAARDVRPIEWKVSFRHSLVAQSTSYAFLIPWFLLISPISLVTHTHAASPRQFVHMRATVYYIDNNDGAVWSVDANGANRRKERDARVNDMDVRLCLLGNPVTKRSSIYLSSNVADKPLIKGVGSNPPDEGIDDGTRTVHGISFAFARDMTDWRPVAERGLTAHADFWPTQAFSIDDANGKRIDMMGFETPFGSYIARCVTMLPGDIAVFQLRPWGDFFGGDRRKDSLDQIMVMNLHTRQLGFIAMGRGPAVVLK
ncbi:MAG: hypothetical protein ACLQVD_10830, partial [Capsulimonadaceae bacterium]